MALSEDNPSPENRDLRAVLRELDRILPRFSDFGGPEFRDRNRAILNSIVSRSERTRRLSRLLEGAPYFVGGDEHRIIQVPEHPDRIYKLTHSNSFGCHSEFHPSDPELSGKHFFAGVNSDIRFYLRRWIWLNSISTYQTRYEGLLSSENERHMPVVCISQPALPPQSLAHPNPTEEEIESALKTYEYLKVSRDAFLNQESGILLTDAAPRNVRIIEGIPVPFDAIAEIASPEVRKWAAGRR